MVADGEVVTYALVKDETTNTLTFVVEEFRNLNPNVHINTNC